MTHAEEIVLHRGALKFTAFTAGSGPLVLCLHGFPDNAALRKQAIAQYP
jgi:hypothetical protein